VAQSVSVVIPVYNAQQDLRRCLDSVFAQDYDGLDVLVINDGSTDGSRDILREYQARHDNLRVVDKPNEGVAATRNLGIEMATGDYLLFVDDDDCLDPDFVRTYVQQLDQDYDIVIGGWRRIDGSGKIIYERHLCGSEWETYINTYPWDKLYRRQFLMLHGIRFLDYGIGEDVFLTLSAKAHHAKVKIIDYVGYTWFLDQESVSNTSHKGLNPELDVLYLLNKVDALYDERPALLTYYYRRFLVWYMLYSGRGAAPHAFMAEYHRLWDWLRQHEGAARLTPFSRRLRGERSFERLSVLAFTMIGRVHLMGPFARLYCAGKA